MFVNMRKGSVYKQDPEELVEIQQQQQQHLKGAQRIVHSLKNTKKITPSVNDKKKCKNNFYFEKSRP